MAREKCTLFAYNFIMLFIFFMLRFDLSIINWSDNSPGLQYGGNVFYTSITSTEHEYTKKKFNLIFFWVLYYYLYSVICRPSDQWPQCGEAPGRAAQTTTPPCKIYFEQILKIQLWHSANLPEIFLSCFSKWARCPPQSPPLPSEKLYKKTC